MLPHRTGARQGRCARRADAKPWVRAAAHGPAMAARLRGARLTARMGQPTDPPAGGAPRRRPSGRRFRRSDGAAREPVGSRLQGAAPARQPSLPPDPPGGLPVERAHAGAARPAWPLATGPRPSADRASPGTGHRPRAACLNSDM